MPPSKPSRYRQTLDDLLLFDTYGKRCSIGTSTAGGALVRPTGRCFSICRTIIYSLYSLEFIITCAIPLCILDNSLISVILCQVSFDHGENNLNPVSVLVVSTDHGENNLNPVRRIDEKPLQTVRLKKRG